ANRADQFLFATDRNHFVAAHGITRNILSGYLQTSPETLSFSVGPNGKPVLSRKTDSLDLRFNLSHSHGLAMLAVALGREVGIDVERIRPASLTKASKPIFSQRTSKPSSNTLFRPRGTANF
ncbi:MAG: hypothetical protein WBV50_04150, partial [Candidatus Acidiferrum sp.]